MKLHEELLVLRRKEKQIGAEILEKLQLMENGRKYLQLGYSSLFDYLVRGLGYSESAAYQKQSCLRLTKEIPEIKEKMDSGALTASGLSMAFKTLKKKTTEEKRVLLKKMENRPAKEIKMILIEEEAAPSIKIQKTEYSDKVILRLELSKEQNAKLERLKALESHRGGLESLLERLIDKGLKKYENTKYKPTSSSNPRTISKPLRNYLFKKAGYKCQYPGCEDTHFLQVDHIVPVRLGGSGTPSNLKILCASHNGWKG